MFSTTSEAQSICELARHLMSIRAGILRKRSPSGLVPTMVEIVARQRAADKISKTRYDTLNPDEKYINLRKR